MTQHFVVTLDASEARDVAARVEPLAQRYVSSDDADLASDLSVLCHDLPDRLKRAVTRFRLEDLGPYLVLRGHTVNQERIGPTPSDWRERRVPSSSFAEELLLLLYASLLGDPFGWRTQQDGRLIHEVFPVRRDEGAQLGTGSRELLTWHTEDAFHPHRADFILLFAIRNTDRVATTVGVLDRSMLEEDLLDVLFEPRFIIRPDHSHLMHNNAITEGFVPAFAEIEKMQSEAEPVAVLFGSRETPYLRLDPYFMDTVAGDEQARRALDAVTVAIDATLSNVVLEAGDLLILDNLRAVHGRRPFSAQYDGTDRWLKRVNVTRDLRRSRAKRAAEMCRIIG